MISKPWKSGLRVFPILGMLILNCTVWAGSAPTSVVARAEQLFGLVEKRFETMQTLQYTVERTTQSPRQQAQERWRFRYRKPGDIRIDYQSPQDRLILVTPTNMVEYLPVVRKALRTDLTRIPLAERTSRVGNVLARVAVDGLRVGDTRAMLARVQKVREDEQQPGAWWVEGEGPRFRVLIDPKRQAVLAMQLWDVRGDTKLQTTAGDWLEVAAGQWMPQRIQAVYGTAEGVVSSLMRLSNIRVNAAVEAGVFAFEADKSVEILER